MAIKIDIDQLILKGINPRDKNAVAASLKEELDRLCSRPDIQVNLDGAQQVRKLKLDNFGKGVSPRLIGVKIAQQIAKAMTMPKSSTEANWEVPSVIDKATPALFQAPSTSSVPSAMENSAQVSAQSGEGSKQPAINIKADSRGSLKKSFSPQDMMKAIGQWRSVPRGLKVSQSVDSSEHQAVGTTKSTFTNQVSLTPASGLVLQRQFDDKKDNPQQNVEPKPQVLPDPEIPKYGKTVAYHGGENTTIIKWANGIIETRKGTIPWRDNNPGDIIPGPFADQNGSIGVDSIPDGTERVFAVFPDIQTGNTAMKNLLLTHTYQNRTLTEALQRWNAGANTVYLSDISRETGIQLDTLLSTLSNDRIEALMESIKQHEGFNVPGQVIITRDKG